MVANVSYSNHYGKKISYDVAGTEFGKAGSYHYVTVDSLVVADARQVVTITIYNADGTVYTTCQESIEDYIARQASTSDVYVATMKFADSAYAYLHRND